MADDAGLNMELPLESVSARLRAAREAAGLSLRDIAARTKIAERHLVAIEAGKFGALASRTYAVGFARTYARVLGLDERAVANDVRDELGAADNAAERNASTYFEPGDPSRIPARSLAWTAALAGFAVVIVVWFVWPSLYSSAIDLPMLTRETPSPAAAPVPDLKQQQSSGLVTLTAREAGIWLKITDEYGTQLVQKEMALGEVFTVPANTKGPRLSTARPDALDLAIDGRVQPRLSDRQEMVREVPIAAADLLARSMTSQPVMAAPSPNSGTQSAEHSRFTPARPSSGAVSPHVSRDTDAQRDQVLRDQVQPVEPVLPPPSNPEASTVPD